MSGGRILFVFQKGAILFDPQSPQIKFIEVAKGTDVSKLGPEQGVKRRTLETLSLQNRLNGTVFLDHREVNYDWMEFDSSKEIVPIPFECNDRHIPARSYDEFRITPNGGEIAWNVGGRLVEFRKNDGSPAIQWDLTGILRSVLPKEEHLSIEPNREFEPFVESNQASTGTPKILDAIGDNNGSILLAIEQRTSIYLIRIPPSECHPKIEFTLLEGSNSFLQAKMLRVIHLRGARPKVHFQIKLRQFLNGLVCLDLVAKSGHITKGESYGVSAILDCDNGEVVRWGMNSVMLLDASTEVLILEALSGSNNKLYCLFELNFGFEKQMWGIFLRDSIPAYFGLPFSPGHRKQKLNQRNENEIEWSGQVFCIDSERDGDQSSLRIASIAKDCILVNTVSVNSNDSSCFVERNVHLRIPINGEVVACVRFDKYFALALKGGRIEIRPIQELSRSIAVGFVPEAPVSIVAVNLPEGLFLVVFAGDFYWFCITQFADMRPE